MASPPHGHGGFLSIPVDIFIQICFWLSVRDILTLRAVNKTIYQHTTESSIWLSLVRRLKIALPPGQPVVSNLSAPGSMQSLEFFVSRALKLEQNWREYNPLAKHYQFNGHQRICTMQFLPGGRHMVTVSQHHETLRESIVVWDMNFRGRRNHVAIALLNSDTPVHKLQARYALTNDGVSLVVAFTRPPVEGKTGITASSIPLEILNTLSELGPGTPAFVEYNKLVPTPFTKLLETRTRYPVGALSLSDINGCPVLAAVHRPRTIVFFDLCTETRSSLKLASVSHYPHWRHSIWDIKLLPLQKQIFVIRVLIGEVDTMDTNPLVFEIFDMPEEGTDVENPISHQRKLVLGHSVDGFYVSNGDASWNFRTHPDLPMLHSLADAPPPPISIFVTTKTPRGFIHYLMLPEKSFDGDCSLWPHVSQYTYGLPVGTHAKYEWDEEEHAVIIPGAYRSVVWMRAPRRQPLEGISVLRLAVYRTEGYKLSDSSETGHVTKSHTPPGPNPTSTFSSVFDLDGDDMGLDDITVLHGQCVEDPRKRFMKYPTIPADLAQAMHDGTWCLQFDEWLGRLCVATTMDDFIQVLDWSI